MLYLPMRPLLHLCWVTGCQASVRTAGQAGKSIAWLCSCGHPDLETVIYKIPTGTYKVFLHSCSDTDWLFTVVVYTHKYACVTVYTHVCVSAVHCSPFSLHLSMDPGDQTPFSKHLSHGAILLTSVYRERHSL